MLRCDDCHALVPKLYRIIQYRRVEPTNPKWLKAVVKRVCRKCLPWYERHQAPNKR